VADKSTVDSLVKHPPWHGLHPAANVRSYILAGLLLIVVVFGGLGAWATIAPLSGAVIATGVVKVDTNRKTVQHLEGGIIKEIRVRDGDHVQAGQTLIVLQDERIGATLDLLQGQLDAELAKAARLQAERDGLDSIEFHEQLTGRTGDPEVEDILRSENVFFTAKRAALADQIALLNREIGQVRDQISGLTEQIHAEEAAVKYLEQEIAANEELEKQQYVHKIHILTLRRNVEEYKARRGEHIADIAFARQKITEIELKIIALKNAHVNDAADKLTTVKAAIYDIEERLRPALDATARQQVIAPITGEVVNLRVFTVGGVIGPRDPILDIVPDDNPLIIEAQVNVEDINDIRLYQEADVRLTAYKPRSTPLLQGKVTYISADRLIKEETGDPYYLAHVEIDVESLHAALGVELYPGMPAEVFIKTGARTALDYLLAPVTQTLRRSMRES